jgi:uncharacterized membrane protein/thiol-disulfide isomerase/thioredoxin
VRNNQFAILLLLIGLFALLPSGQIAQAQDEVPVVHAIMFYSPTCGHCYYVITEILPPLFEKYGDQLQIIGVDASSEKGYSALLSAAAYFKLERVGVPFLIIGDQYLIGDVDIPEKFPGLIEDYLAQGGVDWPAIPGLMEIILATPEPTETATVTPEILETGTPIPMVESLATSTAISILNTPTQVPPTATAMPTSTPGIVLLGEPAPGLVERLMRDPVGNSLAIFVLAGMVVAVITGGYSFLWGNVLIHNSRAGWIIPAISLIGIGVAAYLAYVETAQVEAVCGPVGDCNTVQQSEYARLFGILPIGVLGLVGYVMIIASWAVHRFANGRLADFGALAMLGMTVFGTLFSIYLTFLEPFVIGATCAWCLTSAVIMTVLMLLSISPGKMAFRNLAVRSRKSSA